MINDQEYTDGYRPEHPELIPGNRTEAHLRMAAATTAGIRDCDTRTFLKAWWAFAWLNPGFHPDDYEDWDEHPEGRELAKEAFRRAEIGEIDQDGELYPSEATHNAVWLQRSGSPYAPAGFKDGYVPRHPHLIPANEADARARLGGIPLDQLPDRSKEDFLSAWWALFWLNPGINPEYEGEWDDDQQAKLAEEASRRFKAGELTQEEMFPCEAAHARVMADQEVGKPPQYAYDRLVVIRTDDGRYLSRSGGATSDRKEAARYRMIADRVADQIDAVTKLYGRTMTTETGL